MNLVITSASALAVLHLALLALMPTLIYGHAHRGAGRKHEHEAMLTGAHLVMETRGGDVLVRAARGALAEEATTAANPGAGNKRERVRNNNKKSNKATDHELHAGGRKPGFKKLPATASVGDASTPQQQQSHKPNGKQQRQMLKQQQQQQQQAQGQQHGHQQGHHHGGRKSGQKSKAVDNAEKATNGEKSPSTCRYAKSAWSDCDAKTNMRTRTLTLKKGESNCLSTRTMQKKCKKACRYEKGTWSECSAGQMTREDKLKSLEGGSNNNNNNEQSCEPLRSINKKCNPGGGGGGGGGGKQQGGGRANKERKHKEKSMLRKAPQA